MGTVFRSVMPVYHNIQALVRENRISYNAVHLFSTQKVAVRIKSEHQKHGCIFTTLT